LSIGSEYRQMLGALLVWAILPLLFTSVVMWPFLLVAAAVAGMSVLRPERSLRLKAWHENVLAILIAGVVLMTGGWRVGPLRPLGHLLLLLTAVRMLGVTDRSTFHRAFPAVGLVWVVAVTSSTHITLLPYLAISVGLLWWIGMRALLIDRLVPAGIGTVELDGLPRPTHVVVATVLTLLLAVPVFMGMPRLRSPWLAAGGSGLRAVSGFSSAIELNSVGQIQESREIALVMATVDGVPVQREWTRLRATAFDLVKTGAWSPRGGELTRGEEAGGLTWLSDRRRGIAGTTELTVDLLVSERYLFVPLGTVAVRAPVPIGLDPAGGLMALSRRRQTMSYRVWVADVGMPRVDPPGERDTYIPRPDPEIDRLARDVAVGLADDAARAMAVEAYLRSNYSYSTRGGARFESDPVGWFLFSSRQGHCEYFAGSMVVLLRSLGVPARLVGGYNGGTVAGDNNEVLIRQANAHTWVEVWLGHETGWTTFDPTPSEGVPALAGVSGVQRVRLLWDRLLVVWDRWVLTFGFREQLELLTEGASMALALGERMKTVPLLEISGMLAMVVGVAVLLVLARRSSAFHRRGNRPAATAIRRITRRLKRGGTEIPPGATMRWIGRVAQRRWPAAARAVSELVRLAERESYSELGPAADDAAAIRRQWKVARRLTPARKPGISR